MRQQESSERHFAGLPAQVAVVITLLAVAAASLVSAGPARADHLELGETIIFALPADEPQPDASGEVMFLGGPKRFTDATGCGGGERPVQRIQIRNFGEASEQAQGVIVLSETEPIEAGTRAGNGTFDTGCLIGLTLYFRYEFTVTRVPSHGLRGESGLGAAPAVRVPINQLHVQ